MTSSSTNRVKATSTNNAVEGELVWHPPKSMFVTMMGLTAIIAAPLTFSWQAFGLFIVTTFITVCAGHSVGMHRLHVHRSFQTYKWIERFLVYLGTLVGMAGPIGIIHIHDIRDWAQQQQQCHPYFAHKTSFWRDAWAQLHSRFVLKNPPVLKIEDNIEGDRFYQLVEKTWMLQQLPWAILFYILGGWSWVVWGIAVRVTVSLTGHWLTVHFAHQKGHQGWAVDGVAVQGYNIPYVSLLTFGESHHGNHHAFPGSAHMGIEDGQLDPGWWLVKTLERLGLAWNVKEPLHVGERDGLRRVVQR